MLVLMVSTPLLSQSATSLSAALRFSFAWLDEVETVVVRATAWRMRERHARLESAFDLFQDLACLRDREFRFGCGARLGLELGK